mmetsp:Transcript_24970/g.50120  ORF Transcript_24970/g.50120 Transcript_24970/m.50120 type:complete len:273 (+) Transcript_24970:619-1437(+)
MLFWSTCRVACCTVVRCLVRRPYLPESTVSVSTEMPPKLTWCAMGSSSFFNMRFTACRGCSSSMSLTVGSSQLPSMLPFAQVPTRASCRPSSLRMLIDTRRMNRCTSPNSSKRSVVRHDFTSKARSRNRARLKTQCHFSCSVAKQAWPNCTRQSFGKSEMRYSGRSGTDGVMSSTRIASSGMRSAKWRWNTFAYWMSTRRVVDASELAPMKPSTFTVRSSVTATASAQPTCVQFTHSAGSEIHVPGTIWCASSASDTSAVSGKYFMRPLITT